jgi:hypothetical protein
LSFDVFPTSVWLRNCCLASVPTAFENSEAFDSFGDRQKKWTAHPIHARVLFAILQNQININV